MKDNRIRNKKRNKFNLPNHHFVENGRVSVSKIAKVQRLQQKQHTDKYKRYENYWSAVEKQSKRKQSDEGSYIRPFNRESNPYEPYQYRNIEVNNRETVKFNQQRRQEEINSEDVWVGIKYSEEESSYTLQELMGETLTSEELQAIYEDGIKKQAFIYACWEEFIGGEIYDRASLLNEIADLLGVPPERVKGAQVEMEYREDIEDVVVSFKAKITRGML